MDKETKIPYCECEVCESQWVNTLCSLYTIHDGIWYWLCPECELCYKLGGFTNG